MGPRKHHRMCYTAPVRFGIPGSGKLYLGQTENVSLGGMFIRSNALLPKDAEVFMHGHFKDLPIVFRANGRVARVVPPSLKNDAGMGIELTNFSIQRAALQGA